MASFPAPTGRHVLFPGPCVDETGGQVSLSSPTRLDRNTHYSETGLTVSSRSLLPIHSPMLLEATLHLLIPPLTSTTSSQSSPSPLTPFLFHSERRGHQKRTSQVPRMSTCYLHPRPCSLPFLLSKTETRLPKATSSHPFSPTQGRKPSSSLPLSSIISSLLSSRSFSLA